MVVETIHTTDPAIIQDTGCVSVRFLIANLSGWPSPARSYRWASGSVISEGGGIFTCCQLHPEITEDSLPGSKNASAQRPRRARGSLNPDDIVVGAFAFCHGIPVEDLTMPRLAAFLDVGVTSIYWYFKSKRELLDAMTEEAVTSFYERTPPLHGDTWEEMLREFFVSFYALLAGDELRCDLIVRRIGNYPDAKAAGSWARAEELIAVLEDAGFPPSLARHAFDTLSIYTQGHLLVERTGGTAGRVSSPGRVAESGIEDPAADAAPRDGFEFGITNIIRGLRVLVPGDAEASAAA